MTASVTVPPAATGRLAERPFPRLLWYLHRKQVTGRVSLDHGSGKSTIFLRNGDPVCVDAPDAQDRLDRVLVDAGLVSQQQIDGIEAVRARTGRRLGDLLTGAGLIQRSRLADALKLQLKRKLTRLFAPLDGDFALFLADHPFGAGDEFEVMGVQPQTVVYPGIRASYDSARLSREISVLRDRSFRLAPAGPRFLAQMGFRRDDEDVLAALLHRLVHLEELDILGTSPNAGRSVVLALLYTDLLDVRERAPAEATPAGRVTTSDPGSPAASTPVMPAAAAPAKPSPPTSRRITPIIEIPLSANPPDPAQSATAANLRTRINELIYRLDELDHFHLLGVSENARDDEVNMAYVRAAKVFHPDRVRALGLGNLAVDAARIMARMSDAYAVLGDARKREAYRRTYRVSEAERSRALAAVEGELKFQEGERCLRRGDFARAETAFAEAVRLNREEPEHQALLAWTRFLSAHVNKDEAALRALETLRAVIKVRPQWARGYFFLGQLFKHRQDMGRARAAFETALEHDPQMVDAERELRLIRLRMARTGRSARER